MHNSIDDGYNVSIGGENITGTYLNPHVLEMIRLSRICDKRHGFTEPKNGIVRYVYDNRYNGDVAEIINSVDDEVERRYCDYKNYHSNMLVDGENMRVDAYWWYVIEVLKLWGGVIKEVMHYSTALENHLFRG